MIKGFLNNRYVFFVIVVFFFLYEYSYAFTLNVVGCDPGNNCNIPVNGFRWLLEEDNTTQSPPGVRVHDSVSLSIQNSHSPVISKGSSNSGTVIIDADPSRPYFVTVLPDSGFSLGGIMVRAGATTVTVKVHSVSYSDCTDFCICL